MATFNIQGKVLKPSSQLGVSLAKVKVFQLGQTAPIVETKTGIDGTFSIEFPWATGRPDVHFKVTQMVEGTEKVIYNENPATQTRFNIADVLAVNLKAEEGLAAAPTSGQPYDNLFVFTRVGKIGVNEIDGASGYAFPEAPPAAPTADTNSPFGGTLDIAGWFGQFADVYRYKVQYHDGSDWQDVSDPLSNSYYNFVLGGGSWVTVPMGPFHEPAPNPTLFNLYKLPHIEKPGQPWIFPDLIARWDTSKLANKLYPLRILGFKVGLDGKTLEESSALIIDPKFGTLSLLIDNSPPVVEIKKIEYEDLSKPDPAVEEVKVCSILDFSKAKLRLSFEARDAQGHLRGYSLAAMFGHNMNVSPPPSAPDKAVDSYAAHVDPSRHWNGGTFTVEYDSSTTYTPTKMPKCAYQFRLNAMKRTTNGYGNIFGLEDTVHITLDRK